MPTVLLSINFIVWMKTVAAVELRLTLIHVTLDVKVCQGKYPHLL